MNLNMFNLKPNQSPNTYCLKPVIKLFSCQIRLFCFSSWA